MNKGLIVETCLLLKEFLDSDNEIDKSSKELLSQSLQKFLSKVSSENQASKENLSGHVGSSGKGESDATIRSSEAKSNAADSKVEDNIELPAFMKRLTDITNMYKQQIQEAKKVQAEIKSETEQEETDAMMEELTN
ncbi:hypothetical protein JW887_00520 [Candidatus Dojkabacteria bacterium]|nr:hypothetical protein [Candidatus Dojkabacteria bacterium]